MLRILTLNIEHGRAASGNDHAGAWEATMEQLRDLNLDILTIQEADGAARSWATTWGEDRIGQPARIAQALGMRHVYAPAFAGYGVAVLSRLPIKAARFLRLPPIVRPIYRDGDDYQVRWPEPRAALYALVEMPAGELLVATTHLDIDQNAAPEQLRIAARGIGVAAQFWAREYGAAPVASIFTGDLNMRAAAVSDAIAEIPELLLVPREVLAVGETYPHEEPQWQIDHLLGCGVQARHGSVVSTALSDHAGLLADITVLS